MQRLYLVFQTLIVLSLILGGCAEPPPILPSSVELTSDSSTPLTEVTFLVAPPPATGSSLGISLALLDTVSGMDVQTEQISMAPRSDGRFETTLTVPVGSTLTYRYLRTKPSEAAEVTANFDPVSYRVAYIPGPSQIEETVAGWSDEPHAGSTGRIIGRIINAETGSGQRELLVSAGGITVFSESDGTFRLDGLAEGVHHLTVFSPDGAFKSNAQGALIQGGATTPAELRVHPAKSVFVTFQLTVPEGLSPDAIVRIAGNVSTLGNRFSDLTGGMRVSVEHLPTLVRVGPQHFLAVLSLYAGTDLHYKYTLGDGIWNSERNSEGNLVSRQVILPEEDVVLRDQVTAWGEINDQPVRIMVNVPENTPEGDQISIQFKPNVWFEPLPMWFIEPGSWYYDLYGPLDKGLEIEYRYCRNLQCGAADDADTAGLEASGRTLAYKGEAQIIRDDVRAWRWLEEQPSAVALDTEPVAARPAVSTGIEIAAQYHPSWRRQLGQALNPIKALGADSIIFPLQWQWQQQNPFPLLGLDPAQGQFTDELREFVHNAKSNGFTLALKLHPSSNAHDSEMWWETATRDPLWWQLWFEEYHQFALSAAEISADLGIDVLILGGDWASPALPSGLLLNGEASGSPSDADNKWRSIIQAVREIYPGRVAFELGVVEEVPAIPDFLDEVDLILVDWRLPVSQTAADDVQLMAQNFIPYLDLLESRTKRFNRPLWISVEYASVTGGASSCPPAPDGSCRPISEFDAGREIDPDLNTSFEEQTNAINAVFLATHDRPNIEGLFVGGFNPSAMLWDKSSSIFGKPAEEVLEYWYPRIKGE